MHRAFNSWDPSLAPSRQQILSYLPAPTPFPVQYSTPGLSYGFPPVAGPSTYPPAPAPQPIHRHRHTRRPSYSSSSSEELPSRRPSHSSRRMSKSSKRNAQRRHSQRRRRKSISSSESGSSSQESMKHRSAKRKPARRRHRHGRRSPLPSSSSSTADSSSADSASSSGGETILTTHEMMQASQRAAESVAAPHEDQSMSANGRAPHARGMTTSADAASTHLFHNIQNTYMRHPSAENSELESVYNDYHHGQSAQSTISRQPSVVGSRYAGASSSVGPSQLLPRPTLISNEYGNNYLHPVGAGLSSTFSRVGYQPVDLPQAPPEIHVSPASPLRTSIDQLDPPVVGQAYASPSVERAPLFSDLSPYENRAHSQSRSLGSTHVRPRYQRSPSALHAPPAPSQILAAMQHKSVSEAGFPASEPPALPRAARMRLRTPAAATAPSDVGSYVSSIPSAYRPVSKRIADTTFSQEDLGPKLREGNGLQHIPLGDPRYYVPMSKHPYVIQEWQDPFAGHPEQQRHRGNSGMSCFGCV